MPQVCSIALFFTSHLAYLGYFNDCSSNINYNITQLSISRCWEALFQSRKSPFWLGFSKQNCYYIISKAAKSFYTISDHLTAKKPSK